MDKKKLWQKILEKIRRDESLKEIKCMGQEEKRKGRGRKKGGRRGLLVPEFKMLSF